MIVYVYTFNPLTLFTYKKSEHSRHAFCKVAPMFTCCTKLYLQLFPIIFLQTVLPRRADPTELKAIFEKVGVYVCIFLFSLLCLPLIKEAFHSSFDLYLFLLDQILKLSGCPCVLCLFFSLQYASIKKNDECFMSPQDFVSRFLHAHTDIRLSDEATKLLAGVVDQKKDGLVFLCFSLNARWSHVQQKLMCYNTKFIRQSLHLRGYIFGITAVVRRTMLDTKSDRRRANIFFNKMLKIEDQHEDWHHYCIKISVAKVADPTVKLLCWFSWSYKFISSLLSSQLLSSMLMKDSSRAIGTCIMYPFDLVLLPFQCYFAFYKQTYNWILWCKKFTERCSYLNYIA